MNLEGKGGGGSEGVGRLLDMDAGEVGALCHNHRMGETVSCGLPQHTAAWSEMQAARLKINAFKYTRSNDTLKNRLYLSSNGWCFMSKRKLFRVVMTPKPDRVMMYSYQTA